MKIVKLGSTSQNPSFLVQPKGTFQAPQKQNTSIDWNSVLTNVGTFVSSYIGSRASTRPGAGPTPAAAPQPTGMSRNTRNLLIGGAVIAAGLLIYSMTKKK